MRVYTKEGDTLTLIAMPGEEVEVGEYLVISDRGGRRLIVQVFDVQYANVQGVFEDLLRNEVVDGALEGSDVDPLGVANHISFVKDAKIVFCKLRGIGSGSHYTPWGFFLPSRTTSRVSRLSLDGLVYASAGCDAFTVKLGTACNSDLNIDVRSLDGKLNIITGRKGTGKSHLSKMLLLSLLDKDAPCMVLDVNGEYVNLDSSVRGWKNRYRGKVNALRLGRDFRVRLSTIGLNPILNVLSNALDLPWNSTRVFVQIWRHLKEEGKLSLNALSEAIRSHRCHETIREALGARYTTLVNSRIFDDDGEDVDQISILLKRGAVIIDLKDHNPINRRVIVELLLGKLKEFLYTRRLPAVFLFAEEAHLYLRETYWEDIITRMRHLGLFATFITNQPDTIRENVYRQADNLFIFNFLNERDVEMVSRSAKIDGESVKRIVRGLPPRHCLVVGDVVNNFPVVVKVRGLEVQTMGETRLFFQQAAPRPP